MVLWGREREQAQIDALLAQARGGRSGSLILRGEPGIGKSALLDHAARSAEGMRPLRGTGIETEAELPFAALHLLLRPALDRIGRLPAPQARALEGAFGLATAPEDRFLIGLAALSLLTELAEDGPLLCLVDDAQWMDRSSAEALLFAARRLHSEGIALLFAARDAFHAPGVPELRLEGLDPQAAGDLLREHTPGLGPGVRERILAESGGNPLALIELPRMPGSPHHAQEPLPLPRRIQEAYEARIAVLPPGSQTMLLVAALDDAGDLDVVVRAAGRLGVDAAALGPAERAGFLSTAGGRLSFGHPLMRTAAARRATYDERLAVHRALAGVLDDDQDADRRAWHLAAAVTGRDEPIAAALEQAAGRARERAGHAAAAAALERAARLTPGLAERARRLALSAEAAADAGALEHAQVLADQARRLGDDPRTLARLAGLRGRIAFDRGAVQEAHRILLDGAAAIAGLDRKGAALLLLDAVRNAWYVSDPAAVAESSARLAGLPLTAEDGLDGFVRAARAMADFLAGDLDRALPPFRELVALAAAIPSGMTALRISICSLAGISGDFGNGLAIARSAIEECRADGMIGLLPLAQAVLAIHQMYLGRFRDAVTTATEGRRLATDIGQTHRIAHFESVMAMVAAVQGRERDCRELAERTIAHVGGHPVATIVGWAEWALGLLDLGQGRFEAALERFDAAARGPLRHQIMPVYFAPDQIEAAVRLGLPGRAAGPLARFESWAGAARHPWAEAVLHRCRALLATGDAEAERHWEQAVRSHADANRPFERARTDLLFGEWLRRARRKNEARTHLRSALETFERAGAAPWAERARAELRAAGEAVAQGAPDLAASLSPQELQVVRLAATGVTNREIAAQLFLSPKTVSHHLYRAFPKLGVTTRTELARLDLG
ncbi:helix-turn-helix transcriptional regulator [Nonomuraea jabiensis]|uniref:DNA-binding CsgD family transcriptional regulator n=1 Tax=Nonomuraea jabiensis TaxID=882448 RepID=A0A7W9GCW3_9ACTN|nr:helix-turn-helix transcriptional regulator [Nonomuraea jabiensis]MBB5781311.1 DNA-binding CsgD family transcriptional regulator [Nonomuraea jabiensis]